MIYKVGGFNSGGTATGTMVGYNPTTGWQTTGLPTLINALTSGCGGEWNDKIYLFGGTLSSGMANKTTYLFNETQGTWQSLSVASNFPGVCTTSDKLVRWGTRFVVADATAIWHFDVNTLQWSSSPLPPTGTGHLAVVTSKGLFTISYDTALGKILFYQWMLE
jgi:hypothetical protein